MTAMKNLRLGNNEIGAKACEHLAPALAKLTLLEDLNFPPNNHIGKEGCKHLAPALAKMTALGMLDLGSSQIDAKGCEYLAPALAKMISFLFFLFSYSIASRLRLT